MIFTILAGGAILVAELGVGSAENSGVSLPA